MTIDDFLKQMTIYFPTIKKELDEHIEEFGERLDTIVIEDIIMPRVIDLMKNLNNEKKIKEIFDYFETVSTEADENLLNIFSITVLEMLGADKDILEIAKQYMGPITKKYQRDADLDLGRNIVI
mgnify:FL=1